MVLRIRNSVHAQEDTHIRRHALHLPVLVVGSSPHMGDASSVNEYLRCSDNNLMKLCMDRKETHQNQNQANNDDQLDVGSESDPDTYSDT